MAWLLSCKWQVMIRVLIWKSKSLFAGLSLCSHLLHKGTRNSYSDLSVISIFPTNLLLGWKDLNYACASPPSMQVEKVITQFLSILCQTRSRRRGIRQWEKYCNIQCSYKYICRVLATALHLSTIVTGCYWAHTIYDTVSLTEILCSIKKLIFMIDRAASSLHNRLHQENFLA